MLLCLLFLFHQAVHGQQTIPLSPGQYFSGTLTMFSSIFFSLNISNSQFQASGLVDLSLSRISSNTDMYVTLSGIRPTSVNSAYSSTALNGRNAILIVAGQGPAATQCGGSLPGNCSITIGLYSGLFSSSYALFTSLGRVPSALESGTPRTDWLPVSGSYNFYRLDSLLPATQRPRFTFSVSATSGDPDIFVGTRSPTPRASNASSYCWMAVGSGDVVEVSSTSQPAGCYCAGQGCTYYIGVLAASGSGSIYTILATEDAGRAVTQITDGQPLTGALAVREAANYAFLLPPSEAASPKRRVEVIVTPLSGDPDLYIAFAPAPAGPTSPSNAYSSAAADGPEDVVMSETDPAWGSLGSACASFQ
jgi:hypothetical protein